VSHRRNVTAEPLYRAFAQLSTPLMADAAVRLRISFRIPPAWYSADQAESTFGRSGLGGQTFWKRRSLPGGSARRDDEAIEK
jgi:hypothetical protein